MEAVHLHLLINHVPILLTIFSVLIMLWGMLKSEKAYINLALTGFIIAGVFSIVAFQSGEASEDAVETLAGISESYIHDHEEVAEIANIMAIILAVFSISAFIIKKYKPALFKPVKILVILLGFISSGMFSYTAYLGGNIRHTELITEEADEFIDSGTEKEEIIGDEFDQ